MIRPAVLLALVLASPVWALDLPANARMTAERLSQSDSYAAPVAVFDNGAIPEVSIEGVVRRQAWRIASPGLTPLQVLDPLRRQLSEAGFDILLDCADRSCGGFDFRFGTEVLPAPNMYVNVSDFRFLTAVKGNDAATMQTTTLLVSTTRDAAYLQIIEARSDGGNLTPTAAKGSVAVAQGTVKLVPAASGDVADLLTHGYRVLEGVDFASGTQELGDTEFDAIADLAAFLQDNPSLRIMLVGHTDSVGGLDGNIALSRARARSVRQRLIDRYSIKPERLRGEGMGYLAPRASNLTPEGREANRRVEAVLLPTE